MSNKSTLALAAAAMLGATVLVPATASAGGGGGGFGGGGFASHGLDSGFSRGPGLDTGFSRGPGLAPGTFSPSRAPSQIYSGLSATARQINGRLDGRIYPPSAGPTKISAAKITLPSAASIKGSKVPVPATKIALPSAAQTKNDKVPLQLGQITLPSAGNVSANKVPVPEGNSLKLPSVSQVANMSKLSQINPQAPGGAGPTPPTPAPSQNPGTNGGTMHPGSVSGRASIIGSIVIDPDDATVAQSDSCGGVLPNGCYFTPRRFYTPTGDQLRCVKVCD